ncbi:hypothetical protein OAD66_05405 [Bacteroidia bacterium]|nr:hypothetical protein [Bacteroidia bacterium]MDB4106893.1 hypothetical protein [Bacteroidia bacterium]MDB9882552.1 hypothetical protein [Bacteroidia bacterium]
MKKVRLFGLMIFGFVVLTGSKPKDLKNVVLNDLIAETQYQFSESSDNTMKIVWWLPVEFWATIYAQDESVDEATANMITGALDNYTMVIVIDGILTDFGDLKSINSEIIRKNISITDDKGNVFKPIKDKDIDYDAKMVLNILKPVFSNLLGKMGESMEVLMFSKEGEAILNPYGSEGGINYDEENIDLGLPLASLLKDKECPVDGALMNAKWEYCPFHGKKLN